MPGQRLLTWRSLALFVVLIGLYAAQVAFLMMLNKKHANTRESLGKKAKIVDKSMKRIKAVTAPADGDDDDAEAEGLGQHAFDDKTDWENEDFIFVY